MVLGLWDQQVTCVMEIYWESLIARLCRVYRLEFRVTSHSRDAVQHGHGVMVLVFGCSRLRPL